MMYHHADPLSSPVLTRAGLTINSRIGSACDFHRITMPFMLSNIKPKKPVFVFNRLPTFDIDSVFAMQAQGVRIVVDMDDHFELHSTHPLYDAYRRDGTALKIARCVRLADAVLVTTPTLADALRQYNDNIHVVPNALPFDSHGFTRSTDTESGTPFVFAGGSTHRNDLLSVRECFEPEELTLAGYDDEHPEWRAIANEDWPGAARKPIQRLLDFRYFMAQDNSWQLAGARFESKAHYRKWTADRLDGDYMSAYDGHRCAIAPLLDTPFNACKSNLKILEAGAKGIPIICSSVRPYYNPTDYCADTGALFAAQPVTWRRTLDCVRNDPGFARECGDWLAEHVRKHYHLDDANELRRQIIDSL